MVIKNKILVTGGAGYIGSWLVPMLLAHRYKVKTIDKCIFSQNSLLHCCIYKDFEFIRKDIRKIEKEDLEDCEFVIHLAAIVGEPSAQSDPTLCWEVNTGATERMVKLCDRQKFIFVSTGSVYGKVEGMCAEEAPTNPLGHYGKSKLEAEKIIINSGLDYVIHRPATAFGVSPRLRLDLLINNFVYKALKHGSMVLYEPKAKRTFIHAYDIARSLHFAVENFEKLKREIYNVGDEQNNIEKGEVAEKIKKRVGFSLTYADYMKDPDQRDYEVSYKKIKNKGFQTKYSVDEGIDELIKAIKGIIFYNQFNL